VPQAKKEKIAISDLLVESVEPMREEFVQAQSNQTVKTEAIPVPSSTVSLEGLDAHFIRDTIVDGSKICVGAQFVQTWTLRNPGPNAWPKGCSVRHVGGDNMLNIDNTRPLSKTDLAEASESNILPHAVEAGEEFQFRVMMKAPHREGTAISYWRLKTPAGLPFGHRLWCDIAVVAPRSPVVVAAPASGSATTYEVAPKSNPLYERLLQARAERMKHVQHTQQQQLEHLNQLQLKHNQLTQQRDQEKMERIQRIRKAAVERVLENRRKEHEAALATIKQEPIPSPKAEVAPEEPAVELPVEVEAEAEAEVEVEVEVEAEEKPAEPTAEPVASGMIFPQLDKESPESSTYEAPSTVQPMSPKSQKSTIARTVTVASDDEFFEDAESVALHSDDGFMTDEEYDILDASDEEMP